MFAAKLSTFFSQEEFIWNDDVSHLSHTRYLFFILWGPFIDASHWTVTDISVRQYHLGQC